MNEYFTDGDVERDCLAGVTRCYLVMHEEQLVGFFAVLADAIRLQNNEKPTGVPYDSAPALKLGRMGVQLQFKRRGVGTAILRYVTAMALEAGERVGIRYLTLDAEPTDGLVEWYLKRGFVKNLGEGWALSTIGRALGRLKKGEELRQTSMRLDLLLQSGLPEPEKGLG